jgi:hypothetical protein
MRATLGWAACSDCRRPWEGEGDDSISESEPELRSDSLAVAEMSTTPSSPSCSAGRPYSPRQDSQHQHTTQERGQRTSRKDTQIDASPVDAARRARTTSAGTGRRPPARQRAPSSSARSPCPCPRTCCTSRASCARQGDQTPAGSRTGDGACACVAGRGRTCAPCGRPGTPGMLGLPPPPHHCSSC